MNFIEQHGLSELANQLQSETDRKKYIKVIEMSKVIQSKLDSLNDSHLNRKSSTWSLHDNIQSHRSSALSDNTTVVATNDDMKMENGHVYKVLDRATCIRFQNRTLSKRSSIDHLITTKKQKRISFSPLPIDDSEDDEHPATIHVAIRKDASLYRIPHKKDSRATLVTHHDKEINTECLQSPPHITRVYMKSKSIFKRSYQLNQYTVTNQVTSQIFYKAMSLENEQPKQVLKLVIVSTDTTTSEEQRRFGFTFHCKLSSNNHNPGREAKKFAAAPDSLVREALTTYSQNEQTKGAMPCISKAKDILRDGSKLYVIYDTV